MWVESGGVRIEQSWKMKLNAEFSKEYFWQIKKFLLEEEKNGFQVFPPRSKIFYAFEKTPFEKVRVVVLWQDPYHWDGQAHWLSFSVQQWITLPPSLKNIFKEISHEFGGEVSQDWDLSRWAEQWVFLLNAILTVRRNQPASHGNVGRQHFTDAVIQKLSDDRTGLIFLLWGKFAQSKENLIDKTRHTVLVAPHPSPFSAHSGFFGCEHFKKVNEILKSRKEQEIVW